MLAMIILMGKCFYLLIMNVNEKAGKILLLAFK
jgi:hypothetical protein